MELKNFKAPSFDDYLKNYFTVIAENGHCEKGDDQAPNSYCIYGDHFLQLCSDISNCRKKFK